MGGEIASPCREIALGESAGEPRRARLEKETPACDGSVGGAQRQRGACGPADETGASRSRARWCGEGAASEDGTSQGRNKECWFHLIPSDAPILADFSRPQGPPEATSHPAFPLRYRKEIGARKPGGRAITGAGHRGARTLQGDYHGRRHDGRRRGPAAASTAARARPARDRAFSATRWGWAGFRHRNSGNASPITGCRARSWSCSWRNICFSPDTSTHVIGYRTCCAVVRWRSSKGARRRRRHSARRSPALYSGLVYLTPVARRLDRRPHPRAHVDRGASAPP